MEEKQKSIHDMLPLDLIRKILLRIPVKHLGRLKCVSKLWHTLISDPDFAELHLHLSLAPTHAFLYKKGFTEPHPVIVHLEEVFNGDNYKVKEVSFPFKKPPSEFHVTGSCRGFVLLHQKPYFFVVWNPLTGFSKRVSCSWLDIVHHSNGRYFNFPDNAILYGFGYDASRDDYLVAVAWMVGKDSNCRLLDCFSLRSNSWINVDAALPKRFEFWRLNSHGLFLNGSIHWLSYSLKKHYSEGLLIFDMKERSFSNISLPEQVIGPGDPCPPIMVILGGCLALYSKDYVERKTHIWVMKEYKVQSSWTLYVIPCFEIVPLCLSNGSVITASNSISARSLKVAKYNIRGELLQHFTCPPDLYMSETYSVYTESLFLFPSDSKHKDK